MSAELKKGLVPELRFPEFDGAWEEKMLGEAGKFINGRAYKQEELLESGKYRVLRVGNFFTNNNWYYSDLELEVDKYCDRDDLLYAWSASFGPRIWKEDKVIYHYHIWKVQANLGVDKMFLFFTLENETEKLKADKANGLGLLHITKGAIEAWPGKIPKEIKEQQKIAACLSSLDELIVANTQKLEALKAHKKGLMQQLFPAEGETVPKLRFPEFEGDGEWEEKPMQNYIDLFSGIALKSEELSDDESGIPILRGINITEGFIRHSPEIDKFYLGNVENLQRFLIRENDIVIGMDGSKVGKNVALVKKEDENSILIQRVARIRANSKTDIKYVYQHFISENFRRYVDTVNTSSGIPHISSQQIKDFTIGFPPQLKEQQKIASCLSSLDAHITTQTEKIEALKIHKKGLMQGLFPSEL
jgi:type I restriction enzyme S subunit